MAGEGGVLLTASGITKIFGELKANDNVDLTVNKGEIHALLGENGAGKSTLVKILFGSLQPTEGQIEWEGRAVTIPSPGAARTLGIGMVFQHFSLFDALTVAENIALSLGSNTPIDEIGEAARKLSNEYGLPLDPDAHVGDLSVGERQRIEIIRCLLQDPALIILDEPTSVLTPQEADKLFETLERLAGEGRSILYISHRLEEVQRLCSRATILRHGRVVDACDPRDETAASLASKMVGEEIDVVHREGTSSAESDILLSVQNLSMSFENPFSVALKEISLDVRAGEIIGIAGVAGNGQSEFFNAVSGEDVHESADSVSILGTKAGRMDISQRRNLGAAFVPEERLGHGAVPTLSLSDNLLLARHACEDDGFTSGGLKTISARSVRSRSEKIIKDMDVRMSGVNPPANALSGGNLQKFIVGRELDREPRVLVVNQPTWGVDAGAAAKIRQALIDLAERGSAIVVISQDLDEIFEVSDRIAVMADGRLSAPEAASGMTRERIGLLMAGMDGAAGGAAA
ncbi:MAG: ABC transporter ATP-binding protein [Pseudomonadota bacterium]